MMLMEKVDLLARLNCLEQERLDLMKKTAELVAEALDGGDIATARRAMALADKLIGTTNLPTGV